MTFVDDAISIVPDTDKILSETFFSFGIQKMPAEDVITNFDTLVCEIESAATKKYREYEEQATLKLLQLWERDNDELINRLFSNSEKIDDKKEIFSRILFQLVKLVKESEFRFGQMRKARGGGAFEKIIEMLLNQAGILCEKPSSKTRKLMKRIDYVCPDAKTAEETPDKAFFLAAKRTLRER